MPRDCIKTTAPAAETGDSPAAGGEVTTVNAPFRVIDPKTGQTLLLVGSIDETAPAGHGPFGYVEVYGPAGRVLTIDTYAAGASVTIWAPTGDGEPLVNLAGTLSQGGYLALSAAEGRGHRLKLGFGD